MDTIQEAEKNAKRAARAAYMREYKKRFPHARLYDCWRLMKRRCEDPNHKNYRRYGARGIFICQEWQEFYVFAEWSLANGWREGLQIDRIDNDGPYAPKNCQWVTHAVNGQHTSASKLDWAKVGEIRRLLSEGVPGLRIARQFGVHHAMIYNIKNNRQWRIAAT